MSSRKTYFLLIFTLLFIVSSLSCGYADCETNNRPNDPIYMASFFPRPSPFSHTRVKNRLNRKKISRKIDAVNKENYHEFHNNIKPVIDLILDMKTHPERYHRLLIFWQLGEHIFLEKMSHSDNTVYHEYLLEKLSADLSMAPSTLHSVELLYSRYRIAATLSQRLTWEHYQVLILIEDNRERDYYQNLSEENAWSPEELENAIRKQLYQKPGHSSNGIIIVI